MSGPHVFIDSADNEKHRGRGIQLWRQCKSAMRRGGMRVFTQRRVVDGVTIEARASVGAGANHVRIYGGITDFLIAFFDPFCGPIFWDSNDSATAERFSPISPYGSTGTENVNTTGAYPNIMPLPDVDLGKTASLSCFMFQNRPFVDDWIRAYLFVDGSSVWNDVLWFDDVSPNTFGSGWAGDWDITSRSYATSAILGYNGLASGYTRHGIFGNWLVGEVLYCILYETTGSGTYYYLLGISIAAGTEGDLVEDYLLTSSLSGLHMVNSNILNSGTANYGLTLYFLSNINDKLYKFVVDPGVGVTETEYGYGTDTLEHICCTETYIYWMTKTGGWTSKIYRATHADPSTSTLILTVTTDATWIYANMAVFNIAVDPTDSVLFFQYKEASNPADSNSVKGVLETYDLTVLPSTPTLIASDSTLLDKTVIGLKYK